MIRWRNIEKDRKIYIDSFNNNDNIYGENIKIIIGSTNLFEGVSLFNVREIHILEPWYNKSRYEQIIGEVIANALTNYYHLIKEILLYIIILLFQIKSKIIELMIKANL